jgi:hypothetical protein
MRATEPPIVPAAPPAQPPSAALAPQPGATGAQGQPGAQPAAQPATQPAAAGQPQPSKRNQKLLIAGLIAITVLAIALIVFFVLTSGPSGAEDQPDQTVQSPTG